MEDEDDEDLSKLRLEFGKFNRYKNLVEETYLKEKCCIKRALVLCKAMLKQCGIRDVNDQNVVSICETLIEPAIKSTDPELTLLAIECVGLITILDEVVFNSYQGIFQTILEDEEDSDGKLKDKIVSLKSAVDGLIVHGINNQESKNLFDLVVGKYLNVRNPILRQLAIEGVCKMMFSTKLCDESDNEMVESILVSLLIQLFDKKFNRQNSLVKNVLTIFFKNFVLYSLKRAMMLLNAVTKLFFSIVVAKEDIKIGQTNIRSQL
jgi:hypothetical protein